MWVVWTSGKERWWGGGGWQPALALSLQPVVDRMRGELGREKQISRGRVVGGEVAQGKPCVIVKAEGKSYEATKDEELADDKSSRIHSGKVRGGRPEGAVQGPMGHRSTSPHARASVHALSSHTLLQP